MKNIIYTTTKRNGRKEMTVRQRVLAARIAERVEKNPRVAKEMGISVEYPKNLEKKIGKTISKEKLYL